MYSGHDFSHWTFIALSDLVDHAQCAQYCTLYDFILLSLLCSCFSPCVCVLIFMYFVALYYLSMKGPVLPGSSFALLNWAFLNSLINGWQSIVYWLLCTYVVVLYVLFKENVFVFFFVLWMLAWCVWDLSTLRSPKVVYILIYWVKNVPCYWWIYLCISVL